MKKDVYIITGIMALIVVAFVFGYNRYSQKAPTDAATSASEAASFKVDTKTLIGDADHTMGPTMAKVVVVEFLDPECEACRAFHPRVKKVLSEFDGKIRYQIRYMPFHHNSANAIKALHAANVQGKLWELLDLLFTKQSEWGEKRDDQSALIHSYAKSLGLDMKKFKTDFDSPAAAARIQKDEADGKSVGVSGTPSFYINSVPLMQLGEEPLRMAINSALQE